MASIEKVKNTSIPFLKTRHPGKEKYFAVCWLMVLAPLSWWDVFGYTSWPA
jgi:hypothetical protein